MRLILFAVILLVSSSLVQAQDTSKPMEAARPDQTEGTHAVDRGNLQIETGTFYTRFDTGAHSFTGRLQIRYGLHDHAELQLLVEDGRQRDRFIDETVQSVYPLALGTRINFLEDHPLLPNITFVGYLKLPFTNRSSEQKVYWSPTAIAAFSKELGKQKQFELEWNAGIKQEAYGKEISWLGSAALEYYLTKHFYVFGEYFAEYQNGESPNNNIDGGAAWLITDNFQIDIAGGTTINAEQASQFVTAGIAYRLEKK